MRLISQDGSIDIPYQNFVVERENGIIKIDIGNCGVLVPVGIYSSEEKAIKVMQLIQNQYLDFCCNYHAQSGVFLFPKDSEVEV